MSTVEQQIECTQSSAANRLTFGDWFSALPTFVFAGIYLVTWINPRVLGVEWVPFLVLVMLLEFVILHSSIAIGNVALTRSTRKGRIKAVLGFACLYVVYFIGMSLGFKSWFPLIAFGTLLTNRFLFLAVTGPPAEREQLMMRMSWVAGITIYFALVCFTTIIPLPRFGVRSALGSQYGGGIWIDEPHRPVIMGFLYFLGVGYVDLYQRLWAEHAMKNRPVKP